MRKILPMLLCLLFLSNPVSAMEYTAPEAPGTAQELMPENTDSFPRSFVQLLGKAGELFIPEWKQAIKDCGTLIGLTVVIAVVSAAGGNLKALGELCGALGIASVLLRNAGTMIILAMDTIQELNDYGKMLLPVLTGAMAAHGGFTESTGLYIGTAFFSSLLGNLLKSACIPLIYIYLACSVAASASGENFLSQISSMIKNGISWSLKTLLTVFTTYMSITGVASGSTDAAALKTAKVAISTMVPVVGGILSDASEGILVGARMMKNTAGIYGMLAVLAVFMRPFIKIGSQYLALKGSFMICSIFGTKSTAGLIGDFCTAMGLLLAITGSMCVLLLISTVCFLRGTG